MAGVAPDNLPWPALPDQRFGMISLDPPWHFDRRGAQSEEGIDRTPQRHYATASLDHLATLPISEIAARDAHVMMWITGPLLVEGAHLKLFDAWGVKPASIAFVWIKLWNSFDMDQLRRTPLLECDIAMGLGYTTRQNAEYVVLGSIGKPVRARADIRQVIVSPRQEHSRKPAEYYRRVEHYAVGPRIDMFAGADRPGWTRWGWGHRPGEGDRFAPAAEGGAQ